MTARSKCRSQYRHRFTLQLFPGSGVQICTTHFRRSLIWSTLLCNDLHPEILDRHYPDSSRHYSPLCDFRPVTWLLVSQFQYVSGECVISSVLSCHSKDLKWWTSVTAWLQFSFIWQEKDSISSRYEGRLTQKEAQSWLLLLCLVSPPPPDPALRKVG